MTSPPLTLKPADTARSSITQLPRHYHRRHSCMLTLDCDCTSMVTQDTLPLVEAYAKFKKNEISWEEYIHNLFRLVAGDPHEDDSWHNIDIRKDDDLRKADLLAYS